MQQNNDYLHLSSSQLKVQYPISILGIGSVGKSNLTTRWVQNTFSDHVIPTLQDEYTKRVTLDDQQFVVNITDTCGQEDYVSLRTQWMKGRKGLIFVYAINSEESFIDVKEALELFKVSEQKACLMVVGNKIDLADQRVIPSEQGKALASSYKAQFFETSAKTGYHVDDMFESLLREILQKREQVNQAKSQAEDKTSWCCMI